MTRPSEALVAELAEFVAIPSVSADAAHAADIETAATWIAARIREGGGSVELLTYAHFDVQPPDPLDL